MTKQFNTKLTKEQKSILRDYRSDMAAMGAEFHFNPETGITVLTVPDGSRMMRVCVSIASPYEKRARKSVGEWMAVSHYEDMNWIVVPLNTDLGLLVDAIFYGDLPQRDERGYLL